MWLKALLTLLSQNLLIIWYLPSKVRGKKDKQVKAMMKFKITLSKEPNVVTFENLLKDKKGCHLT